MTIHEAVDELGEVPQDIPPLMSTAQAAKVVGVSADFIRRAIYAGELRAIYVTDIKILITRENLWVWLASRPKVYVPGEAA